MVSVSIEVKFTEIMEALAKVLKPRGYAKSRHTFRRLSEENSAVIEVQRSVESNQDRIKFTINIGIVCGRLLEDWEPVLTKAGWNFAHLRVRIGFFLADPCDKWWILYASTDTSAVCKEVGTLIERDVVPFLSEHLSERDLVRLWKTGRSPGLTEQQRVRHLHTLTATM